jgi:hypothetical protein
MSDFAKGALTGLAAAAALLLCWLAVALAGMRGMYADFGGRVPAITALAVSAAWRWGGAAAGLLAVGALGWRRPKRATAYVLVAALLGAAVVATWWWSQAPLRELAGNIGE